MFCYYEYLYYVMDVLEVLDVEYDCLMCKLCELESQYLELIILDLLIQRVGVVLFIVFSQICYEVLMLLLDNVFDEESFFVFNKWVQDCLKSIDYFIYCCEFKFDGFVVSIFYENGVLVQVVICGDGIIGEDIIFNV